MGAGKTTIGRRLARTLGLEFVDADHALEERTGVDIPRIFDIEGEEGFRRRETGILRELTERAGIVLATGGGAVQSDTNRRLLAARGIVVYLRASVDTQLSRTRQSDRPLLQTASPRERLQALFDDRSPLYEEVADIVVDTDNGGVERIVADIIKRIDEI
jgi:shikimate kinase